VRRFDRRAVGEAWHRPGGGPGRKRADRALKKRVVERALAGELTHHLGYAKGEAPEEVETHRNGYSEKTLALNTKLRILPGTTQWSSRRLAAQLRTTHMTVSRIWARHGLQPWRLRLPSLSAAITARVPISPKRII
jgi:hypothetical protein